MYTDGPIPELDTAPLPAERGHSITPRLLKLLTDHLPKLQEDDVTVRLARSYERKGFESFDAVPGKRSGSYTGPDDDYVVSISVRVRAYDTELFTRLEHFGAKLEDERIQAEQDSVRAQLDELNAREAELAAQRAALQAKLV